MIRCFQCFFALGLVAIVAPLRAGGPPPAKTDSHPVKVWTNDDLKKLHDLGLISIVGQPDEEKPKAKDVPRPYVETEDPEWYAAQAAQLNDELEYRKTQLSKYQQAIDDARNLRKTTDSVDLDEGEFANSPEAGVEILKRHVDEVQMKIQELEDLARRNDIPPGVLRGQQDSY
jgi:hypothetical protein